eukprot:TRINITY_DN22676_c0_g1_i1.p1 TRINITY_DN22676_c0_g1~~TRINITY_DN22676_c0_g1_i1.p1  ORF type:complete len:399 (-),score=51.64 TRINITY_DN22676_c0_g1_i1:292-1488(-)
MALGTTDGPSSPVAQQEHSDAHRGLTSSPSVTELLPSRESPLSKKQRRLTFSAITGALSEIIPGEDGDAMEDEPFVAPPIPACFRAPPATTVATTSLNASSGISVQVQQQDTSANVSAEPAVAAAPGTPPLKPAPTRRPVRRAAARRRVDAQGAQPNEATGAGDSRPAPMTPPCPVRSVSPLHNAESINVKRHSLKRTRDGHDPRESIGATARVEAMTATATRTLRRRKSDSDASSTDEENSFAYRVKHAHSFNCGVKVAQAAINAAVESPGVPKEASAIGQVPCLESPLGSGSVLPLGTWPLAGAGSPAGTTAALSRKAFKSGVRAVEVAAKVEAEWYAGEATSTPGGRSSASLRSPGSTTAAKRTSGSSRSSGQTILSPVPRLDDARAVAHALFSA